MFEPDGRGMRAKSADVAADDALACTVLGGDGVGTHGPLGGVDDV